MLETHFPPVSNNLAAMRIIPRQLRDINSGTWACSARSVFCNLPKWPKSPRMPIYTQTLSQTMARAQKAFRKHTYNIFNSVWRFFSSARSHNKQISRAPRGDKLNSAAQRCFIAGHTVVIAPTLHSFAGAARIPRKQGVFCQRLAFAVCASSKKAPPANA